MFARVCFGSVLALAVLLLESETSLAAVVPITVLNPNFEDNGPHSWPGYGSIVNWPASGTGGGNVGLNPSVGTPACCGQSPFAPDNDGGVPDLMSPQGGQFAFMQVNPGPDRTITQALTGLIPGRQHTLTYYDAHRNGDAGLGATLSPQIDGVSVAQFMPSNTTWNQRTVTFVPTGTSAVLGFRAENRFGNDQTVDVDGITVDAHDFPNPLVSIPDFGFENPVQPGTSGFDGFKQASGTGNGTLVGSAWTFTGGAGISRNVSAFQTGEGGQLAFEGEQLALIQSGGSFSQMITGFLPGTTYSLSFERARRAHAGGTTDIYDVLLDSSVLFSETLANNGRADRLFTTATTPSFVATQSSYLLTFQSANQTGDETTFFDNLRFNIVEFGPIPEPSALIVWSLLAAAVVGAGWRRRRR
jgi:hypothetical protein